MPRLTAIALDQPNPTANGVVILNVALWADVPAARQRFYAAAWGPSRVSAWLDATAQDNANLQNGSVVERVIQLQTAPGTPISSLEPLAVAEAQNFQASITSTNPWAVYGSSYDGTAWTIVTVA
jgi:hypothetical protein